MIFKLVVYGRGRSNYLAITSRLLNFLDDKIWVLPGQTHPIPNERKQRVR